jgi:hypothetical protein
VFEEVAEFVLKVYVNALGAVYGSVCVRRKCLKHILLHSLSHILDVFLHRLVFSRHLLNSLHHS